MFTAVRLLVLLHLQLCDGMAPTVGEIWQDQFKLEKSKACSIIIKNEA